MCRSPRTLEARNTNMDSTTKRNLGYALVLGLVVAQLESKHVFSNFEVNLGMTLESSIAFILFWVMKGDWFTKMSYVFLLYFFSYVLLSIYSDIFVALFTVKFFVPAITGVTVSVFTWLILNKYRGRAEWEWTLLTSALETDAFPRCIFCAFIAQKMQHSNAPLSAVVMWKNNHAIEELLNIIKRIDTWKNWNS